MRFLQLAQHGFFIITICYTIAVSAKGWQGITYGQEIPGHSVDEVSPFEANRRHFVPENYHRHQIQFSNGETLSLHYHSVGDVNVTMGDIVVHPQHLQNFMQAEREAAASGTGLLEFDQDDLESSHPLAVELKGVGARRAGRWPCPIPVLIPASFPNPDRVRQAIVHIEQRTHWRFVQRTTQQDFLVFQAGEFCGTSLGRLGGPQVITLEARCLAGAAMHEILHALGMYHEHTALNRDQYIQVIEANIDQKPGIPINFEIAPNQQQFSNYNFHSIMHYESDAFSNPQGAITIRIRDEFLSQTCHIGNRQELSLGDVQAAQALYGLAGSYGASCPFPSTPTPTYPQCDMFTELRICGRQGSNSEINGKYYQTEDHRGRPAFIKDARFALFWENVGGPNGAWFIAESVGSNRFYASSLQGNLDPRRTTEWRVFDSRTRGFVADPAVHGATCDFGDQGAMWPPGVARPVFPTFGPPDSRASSLSSSLLHPLIASFIGFALHRV